MLYWLYANFPLVMAGFIVLVLLLLGLGLLGFIASPGKTNKDVDMSWDRSYESPD